jgi:hypothetical protein
MENERVRVALRLLRPDRDLGLAVTPLYLPDTAIAQLVLGSKADLWRPELIRQLEREGLPQRRQLLGTMRFVPGVFRFFAQREGLLDRDPHSEDGPENFD